MLIHSLLVAHIVVLGYWLGSELVINSTYRHISWAGDMQKAHRNRLMDHVMHVDQHVRYALVLQFGLGFNLAFLMGFLPGSTSAALLTTVLALAWLILVEVAHRLRKEPMGVKLAVADRGIRYVLMTALVLIAGLALLGQLALPAWLAWKLACFAGVMGCGVGIRLVLIRLFRVWNTLPEAGPDAAIEADIRSAYRHATSILCILWILIAVIAWLSVTKPV